MFGGELVADTVSPILVWEWPHEVLHVKVATATADLAARRYPDSPLAGLRERVRRRARRSPG